MNKKSEPTPSDSGSKQPGFEAERFAGLCKALGHPVRVKIFRHLLTSRTCQCGEIASLFPLAQSTVSQHLKLLKQAGLVCGTVEGPNTCYCLDQECLQWYREQLSELLEPIGVTTQNSGCS